MGPPLIIINEFIYNNIISLTLKVSSGEKQHRGSMPSYWAERKIPTQDLSKFLHSLIPSNINKQKRNTFEERISGILSSYEAYIV